MNDHAPSTSRDVEQFNEWSRTYDASLLQALFFTRIHRQMLRRLEGVLDGSHPARVIDIGCGTGRLLDAVAARWPGVEARGADPSEGMVAEAQRLRPDLRIELASAEALPFPDSSADVVTTSLSFHHWVDQSRGIAEIARILRPGGLFCIADHTFTPARIFRERPLSARELAVLLGESGLAVEHQGWAHLPFILVTLARKG